MAGRQASQAVTRYAGIQVQTSALGMQIPVGWGTFRCRCNLVDYFNFQSKAQKAAGKGGVTTGYSYSASLVLAICEGPIDHITQVWVNGKQYAFGSNGSGVPNTQNTAALAQVGLSLAFGSVPQTPWAGLPASRQIGYSGLAITYAANYPLDSSASTPNHSFEVVRQTGFIPGGYAGPDVDPSLVITDFFTNTRTGVPSWPAGLLDTASLASAAGSFQKYTLAAGLLLSPLIDQQRSATDFLNEIFLATNSTCVWSEGLLKFVPYGDATLTGAGVTYVPNLTPIYSLADDDYIVKDAADPPITVDIQDQSDAYNVVQLEYLDRTNQYNMAIALASDAANVAQYGMRRKDPDTVHVICTPAVAALAAQLWLQRTLYIRAQYKFRLGWMFALLEPGDLLEVTDAGLGLAAYMVRITQIDEDEKDGTLDLTCEDYPIGVHNAPLYTMQESAPVVFNQAVDPGGVEANLLLWSQDFTQGAWSKSNVTVTAAATANPITGASDAQKVLPSTASTSHRLIQTVSNCFANANYVLSGYFRPDGYTQVVLQATDGTNTATVFFDINAGTVLSESASGAVIVAASIASAGGGWQRCALTFVTPLAPTTVRLDVGSGGSANFAGDGVSAIFAWGVQLTQGLDLRPYAETGAAICGPQIFNPPMALTPGGVAMWAACAGGANWGGANVWVSYDGTNYEEVGVIDAPARFGQLTAGFASGSDPDTTDTLSVDLSASNGALTSASQATADASGTLCLVNDSAPELVAFETATLTAPNRYSMAGYVRRGVLGTPIGAHAATAPFIRLDQAVFDFPYLATQAGKSVSVKFQSFNLWGQSAQPLSNCLAYSAIPVPLGARAPASAAWTASPTTISNGGASVPAILITGHSDNASASAIEFFYRPTGTSGWISAGTTSNSATQFLITGVAQNQTYDVAVAYVVSGVLGQLQIVTSGGATTPGGGSGGAPGTVLLSDSVAGTSKTFTVPSSFTGAHVDVVLTGVPGSGSGQYSGGKGGSFTDTGGGGAGVVIAKGFPCTAGYVFTYTLPGAVGSDATVTGTGLSLTAHPGTNAGPSTEGAGAPASTGNSATGATSVTAYAGVNGGAVDTWDGGGPGATINATSGTVTSPGPNNTSQGAPAVIPGQGGAGSIFYGVQAGGGCNLLIIARV